MRQGAEATDNTGSNAVSLGGVGDTHGVDHDDGSSLTRRGFVGGLVASGLGLAASSLVGCAAGDTMSDIRGETSPNIQPQSNTTAQEGTSTSQQPIDGDSLVFVEKDTIGSDDGVERLIALMTSNGMPFYQTSTTPQGLFSANDVIILKINCQWAQRGGTNTDLLEQVARAIAAHPDGFTGEVIVADNGQAQYGSAGTGGSLDWDETNSADRKKSALDVVKALNGQMNITSSLWDDFTMQQVGEFSSGDEADGFVLEEDKRSTGIIVSYPKFTTEYGTKVSFKEGVWDPAAAQYASERLKVINLPVLKVHGLYQVTGAVKAYMGTTASKLTSQAAHNSVGNGGMGTQMAYTRAPTLNIMDMIWVGIFHGPGISYDNAVEVDTIAASSDPVALDWWCARNVLIPLLERNGGDTRSADPDSSDNGTFGAWLGLTANELLAAGLQANRGTHVQVFEH